MVDEGPGLCNYSYTVYAQAPPWLGLGSVCLMGCVGSNPALPLASSVTLHWYLSFPISKMGMITVPPSLGYHEE